MELQFFRTRIISHYDLSKNILKIKKIKIRKKCCFLDFLTHVAPEGCTLNYKVKSGLYLFFKSIDNVSKNIP